MMLPMQLADPRPSHVIMVSLVLAAAIGVSAWIALPLFLSLGAVGLILVAYAAHRWPRATLAIAAMGVLADPVLVPTVLPDSLSFGPIGISEPMIGVASLVITINALRRGTFWAALRDPVIVFMALFVVVAAASALVNATPPVVAVLGIFMTVDAVAIYAVARMLPRDDRAAAITVGAVVGVAAAAALLGIAQVVLHPDLLGFASFAGRFGEGGRITAFLGNPNSVAAIVGFVLPFPILASWRLPNSLHRRLAFATSVMFCLALLLTFSRGAWLAVGAGMLVGLLILERRAILTLAAAVVLAWFVSIVMPRNLLVPAADLALYFPESGAPSIFDSTLDRLDEVYEKRDLRMRFIREGLPIAIDNPILGVGPGRYGGAAAAIIPSPVYEEYGTSLYGFRTVHNFWLHLAGEVGGLGTAVFLTAIVALLLRFIRAARGEADPLRSILISGTAVALMVTSLNNGTEMLFEGNFPGFVTWLVLGTVAGIVPAVTVRRPISGLVRSRPSVERGREAPPAG
jgi:O-antigen ligase